jgi:LPXTG-motif cell wall-anchored protein
VKLSVNKLRRSTTVIGGAFLGLGVAAALATPALACDTIVKADTTCATADGWTASWKVQNDYHPDAVVKSVVLNGVDQPSGIGDIKPGAPIEQDYKQTLTGSSKFDKSVKSASLSVTLDWPGIDTDESHITAYPSKHGCDNGGGGGHPHPSHSASSSPSPSTSASSSAPPSSTSASPSESGTPTDTPTIPIPSESTDVTYPDEIYKADCTSVTIGLDNTNTPIEYKLTFTPKTGSTQVLDIKSGEKKSATFGTGGADKYSVKLSLVAVYKGQTSPAETVTVPYEKPASCSSQALAVTGSSSTPIAVGAGALVLIGGGAFFMARRRKMRFTA